MGRSPRITKHARVDGHKPTPPLPVGARVVVTFPGPAAIERGDADWCQGCNRVMFRHHMQWTTGHLYRCRDCVGPCDEVMSHAVAALVAAMTEQW